MPALTIVAADNQIGASGVVQQIYQVGEAIGHGEVFYRKAADSKHYKTDDTSVATSAAVAIATSSADGDGGFVSGISDGLMNPGATLAEGETYYVGTAPGTIVPSADVGAGEYVTKLGIVKNGWLDVNIDAAGVPHG